MKFDTDNTVAYDTETTGLDLHGDARMFSFCTTNSELETEVCRLDGRPLRIKQSQRYLDRLWEDTSVEKVMHNAKFDLLATEKRLKRKLDDHTVHCTHKASHILQNNHHSHSLEELMWDLAEYPRCDKAIARLGKKLHGYQNIPESQMHKYQIADGERGFLAGAFFLPKIFENKEWTDEYNEEMKLIRTTMRMEQRGIMIDRKRTERLIMHYGIEAYKAKEQIFEVVGRRFNVNSNDQMRRLFYNELGFPVFVKTKNGGPSVDKNALAALRIHHPHAILDLFQKYQSYTKGVATFEGYLELADDDGILHPNINTCQAVTTRESCTNPNLQNVQKVGVLLNPFPVAAREPFRPRPGYVHLHIDYAGVEMRLLVHYSQDPEMLECLNNGDGDVHSLAAAELYSAANLNVPTLSAAQKNDLEQFVFDMVEDERRKTLRGSAKNANFASPYGAGPAKIAKILGLPLPIGRRAALRYAQRFPTLVGLGKSVSKWVKRDGFVSTTFGRRLHVSRQKAYAGTNYLIQGTAAGVLKRAQNRVHEYNEKETGGEVKLLLPIHDEIVIEYPRNMLKHLGGYSRDIRKLMVDFPQFSVPLEISVDIVNSSWARKHAFSIPE